VGRKSTLVASLLLMGISTFLVAFLPGYAVAGWVAPALLCLLRFGQGFGLGGEWGGASLLAVENAPKGMEARFGIAAPLGAPLGFLFANGLFLVLGLTLSESDFLSWGWRVPFLASSLLVILGLWIRLKIGETPAFKEAMETAPPPRVPIGALVTRYPGAVLAGTMGVIACFALFYLATTFALSFATTKLGYPRETVLAIQLGADVVFAIGIIVSGWWSDAASPRTVMAVGAGLTGLVGFVFGAGLAAGSLPVLFLTLSAALFVMGLCYGPIGAWLPSLYPVSVRYTGISLAFNLGGIVGGAIAPLGAAWLATNGGVLWTGLVLTAAGIVTLVGVLAAPREV
jgi:MFS family permease